MKKFFFLFALIAVVFQACGSQRESTKTVNLQPDPNLVAVDQAQLSLSNYLRRVPGLFIDRDGRVLVRGATTLGQDTEPLLLVDGVPVTNNISDLDGLVEVNDIATIRVLKDGSETAMYGARGNNGVILIKTKQQ